MASTDARPIPRKNVAYRHYYDLRLNTGALASTVTGADTELMKDATSFADATNEFTESGTSGCGYIDLTAAEMNYDAVVLKTTFTNTNAVPYVTVIFPQEDGDIRVSLDDAVATLLRSGITASGTTTGTQTTTSTNLGSSGPAGDIVGQTLIVSVTGAGLQSRTILTYNGTTKAITWETPLATAPTLGDAWVVLASPIGQQYVPVDVKKISGDAGAADNLEAALDGTGGVTISAALSGSVGSVAGNVSGSVGSVAGNVGGNVAGSVASVVAMVNADSKKFNGVTIQGTGTTGDKWRGS